jgi:hypothetical protein
LADLVSQSRELCEAAVPGVELPDVEVESDFLAILFAASAVGTLAHRSPAALSTLPIDDRRRTPEFDLAADRVKVASAWFAFLSSRWTRAIATGRFDVAGVSLGEELVRVVCSHTRDLFRMRRELLRADIRFRNRTLDPLPYSSSQ